MTTAFPEIDARQQDAITDEQTRPDRLNQFKGKHCADIRYTNDGPNNLPDWSATPRERVAG